jgi:archaellum biogenesis ATPase FlaH
MDTCFGGEPMTDDYQEFEKDWAASIDSQVAESLKILDEKFPLSERVLRLQQVKSDEANKKQAQELEKFESNLLPTFSDRIKNLDNESGFKIQTGFEQLDSLVGGFRSGNSYLVAGLEKSGKSSLLMDILDHNLKNGVKVGYVNTELMDSEFADRMASIRLDKSSSEIEKDNKLRTQWAEEVAGKLFYAGVQNSTDLKNNNILSFEKTIERMNEFVRDGAKVIMLDNLTTYNTLADGKRKGWEVLANCISLAVNFAKERQIILFLVIHTKPSLVLGETPGGVRHIVQDDPKKIFVESVVVSRKPSLSDVYGGGGALSQLSGALMVWRPYQKFSDPKLTRMTMVILDSFRHAPSGGQAYMEFQGDRSTFKELEFKTKEEELLEVLNK